MAKIKITLVKSTIGCLKNQIDTVRALGLRKINSEVIQEESPAIMGMINKVSHLIKVEKVND